jgi:hypothetical protein
MTHLPLIADKPISFAGRKLFDCVRRRMGPKDEDDLLRFAIAGDGAAFAALLQKYEPQLLEYASRRLPVAVQDLCAPEDIVQDTCYGHLVPFTTGSCASLTCASRRRYADIDRDERVLFLPMSQRTRLLSRQLTNSPPTAVPPALPLPRMNLFQR